MLVPKMRRQRAHGNGVVLTSSERSARIHDTGTLLQLPWPTDRSTMTKKTKIEYGDFQTPVSLAREICRLLGTQGLTPDSVVEPTCGAGSLLHGSISTLRSIKHVYGFDINPSHVASTRNRLGTGENLSVEIRAKDFFQMDWASFFAEVPGSILVIGNPPWVTNAALGVLCGENLPEKSNFQKHAGLAAKTGKANFDISEWMLIRLLEGLQQRDACLAMLCKTGTARKTLRYAWVNHLPIHSASIHSIDAAAHFGVSAPACLLVARTGKHSGQRSASVYADLSFDRKISRVGLMGKELVADVDDYEATRDLDGIEYYKWRSGVKHDAVRVMEFTRQGGHYVNGLNEVCDLEDDYLYPLLKSSDLANNRLTPTRFILVTQRRVGDNTETIRATAPRTWAYLLAHAERLDGRKSIVYRGRARFSIFGVGDYTFASWKVAVAGLYKNIHFRCVGNANGKPILVDDTCYCTACKTRREARFITDLLNADISRRFIHSLIFFDAKRPINAEVLRRIDLMKVAQKTRLTEEAKEYLVSAAFEAALP